MSSSAVLSGGRAKEGENEGAGGSCTRDNAICHCTLLCRAAMIGAGGFGLRLMFERKQKASYRNGGLRSRVSIG